MKKIIFGALVLILLICCFIPGNYNSKYKLNVVSSYGDDESYHPKVLAFDKEWNGYKYWMSYTPYPSGDDRKENPHIVASNDLVTWEKVLNPDRALDEPAGNVPLKIYNSDAHIVYNDDLDRMEMYWRFVDDTTYGLYIYRMTSDNGVDWTEKEISAYSPNRLEKDYVSPAILYDNGTYKMWYVGPQNKVYYTESSDGLEWTNEQVLDVKYEDNTNTWHIDVIKSDIGYEMIAVSYDEWKNHNDMNLYYTSSKDGLNWETGK